MNSLFLEPLPVRCARTFFQSSMVDKLTLYFLSKKYRADVLSLTIFMIGLLAIVAVVRSFLEITVLVFPQILCAALPASTVVWRCRGSNPISAPNVVLGEDFEAPVILLRIGPLSLYKLAIVFCLTLFHQTNCSPA